MSPTSLPLPCLERREVGSSLTVLVDEGVRCATGLSVAFTERAGGMSRPPFEGLNLGTHVGDDPAAVAANRAMLFDAFGVEDGQVVTANQVHGCHGVVVRSPEGVAAARAEAADGADAVLVTAPGVGALLCFADCVPVIIASPTGSFAVVHAGWRGVEASIAPEMARRLAEEESGPGQAFSDAGQALAQYNVYLGPYIHSECFAVGEDVAARFVGRFGRGCLAQEGHVDLGWALVQDLRRAGVSPQRIADAGLCTVCSTDRFFSHRASGGHTGRHGAFACRAEGRWAS